LKYKEFAQVLEKELWGDYLWLKLKTIDIAHKALPGQFVNIRVGDGFDPLLRRPFSICDVEGDSLSVLILVKGRGTSLLSKVAIGDNLNILGPLGNAFPVTDKSAIFVAGGIGIAPFVYLSRNFKDTELCLGVRSAELLPPVESLLFSPLRDNVSKIHISSDDGTIGVKGNVIDLLKDLSFDNRVVYVCGTDAMFRAVASFFDSLDSRVEAYFSLETYMGCGFGACKGCAVEGVDGSVKMCCTDGAVFRYNEVKW
jgi:dihydroorotate dehydrogenase electron transfer subunit